MDEATKKRRLKIARDLMKLSPKDRVTALKLAVVKAKMKVIAENVAIRLIYKAKRNSKTTAAILASIQQNSKKADL